MNKMQEQVRQFQQAVQAFPSKELTVTLIKEEVSKLLDGLTENDDIRALESACSAIIAIFGAVISHLQVDLEPFFNEVHRTDMQKSSGPLREDGKRLPPSGWTPPRLDVLFLFVRESCDGCEATGKAFSSEEGKRITCPKCSGVGIDPKTVLPDDISVTDIQRLRDLFVHSRMTRPKCMITCKICYPPPHLPGERP